MTRYLFAAALGLALFLPTGSAQAGLFFSVDPASPAPFSPNDVLTNGPVAPALVTAEAALGLSPGDNLNALSGGKDQVLDPTMYGLPHVYFSVDRLSIGAPGSAVDAQAFPGAEAHGDVFRATGMGTNALHIDQSAIPLTPGFFGDDLDALNLVTGTTDFFSVDFFSALNGGGIPGTGVANDILMGPGAALFADGDAFGLDVDDDIDALMLLDQGMLGVLDAGDRAYFSLSSFSPTTFIGSGGVYVPGVAGAPIAPGTVSAADILYTDFMGPILLAATAGSIGLDPFDELNALANPEPGSLALLACGMGGFAIYRRRKRRQA